MQAQKKSIRISCPNPNRIRLTDGVSGKIRSSLGRMGRIAKCVFLGQNRSIGRDKRINCTTVSQLAKIRIIHLSKKASPKMHLPRGVTTWQTPLHSERLMIFSASDRCMSAVCVSVKSKSVFPDLVPFETEVFLPLQRRAKPVLAKFGASCREYSASLPKFELYVFVAMVVLAST